MAIGIELLQASEGSKDDSFASTVVNLLLSFLKLQQQVRGSNEDLYDCGQLERL